MPNLFQALYLSKMKSDTTDGSICMEPFVEKANLKCITHGLVEAKVEIISKTPMEGQARYAQILNSPSNRSIF